jgi:hypothetical protein
MNEHYCRRWVSIRTIEAVLEKKRPLFSAQISCYDNSNNEYLVFSQLLKIHLEGSFEGVGILISAAMKFKFIDSGIIKKELVGVTCELVLLKL